RGTSRESRDWKLVIRENGMKKLGELLRNEREKRSLSLHEIGLQLKISAKILQAMESGDESKLPAKTFLRGFVRSYAQYLKIDVAQAMNLFQEEMGSTHPDLLRNLETEASPSLSPEASPESPIKIHSGASTGPKAEEVQSSPQPPPIPIGATASTSKSGKRTLDKGPKEKNTWDAVDESMSSNKMMLTAALVVLVGLILFVSKLIEKYKKEQNVTPGEIAQITNNSQSVDSAAKPPTPELKPLEPSVNPPAETSSDTSSVPASPSISTPTPPTTTTVPASPSTNLSPPSATPTSSASEVSAEIPAGGPTKRGELPSITPIASIVTKTASSAEIKPEDKAPVKSGNPNKTQITATPAAQVKPTNVDSSGSVNASKPEANTMTEVIVEATSPISINYDIGNGQTRKVDLKATQFHTFRSRQFIDLKISDGGAAQIILNGRLRGAAGPKGQAVELKYPRP
ncbi:MAG: helix-turn-helix domain-containing protein, partial [Bdellovibrio sp.]